jgi:hypothetical protein
VASGGLDRKTLYVTAGRRCIGSRSTSRATEHTLPWTASKTSDDPLISERPAHGWHSPEPLPHRPPFPARFGRRWLRRGVEQGLLPTRSPPCAEGLRRSFRPQKTALHPPRERLMFTILGNPSRRCDGVSRRQFLTAGALGLGGLTLADLLRAEAAAGIQSSKAFSHCTPGGSLSRLIGATYNRPVGPARTDTMVPSASTAPGSNTMRRPECRPAPPRNRR